MAAKLVEFSCLGLLFSSSSFVEKRFVFPLPYVLGIIMREHEQGGRGEMFTSNSGSLCQ